MVRCTLWAMGAVLVPTSAVLPSHPMRPDGGAPGLYAQYDWPVPKGISNDMRIDHTVSPSPRALTQCSKQFKSCSSHDTCSGTRKSTASFRRCCPKFIRSLTRCSVSLSPSHSQWLVIPSGKDTDGNGVFASSQYWYEAYDQPCPNHSDHGMSCNSAGLVVHMSPVARNA